MELEGQTKYIRLPCEILGLIRPRRLGGPLSVSDCAAPPFFCGCHLICSPTRLKKKSKQRTAPPFRMGHAAIIQGDADDVPPPPPNHHKRAWTELVGWPELNAGLRICYDRPESRCSSSTSATPRPGLPPQARRRLRRRQPARRKDPRARLVASSHPLSTMYTT
jgi:hypothetical protein